MVAPGSSGFLVDVMKGVMKNGTVRSAAKMPYFLAGKTGTTDDFRCLVYRLSRTTLCCLQATTKNNLGGKEFAQQLPCLFGSTLCQTLPCIPTRILEVLTSDY